MAKPAVTPPLVLDSFNRADSTTTLGSTDGGSLGALAWGKSADIVWGISSNKGYEATPAGNPYAFVDTSSGDGVLSCDVLGVTNSLGGICFRYLDTSNNLFARYNLNGGNNVWELYKVVAGSFTLLGSTSSAGITNGVTYRLEVTFRGSALTFKVDGVTKASATDSAHSTRTKHGLYGHTAGSPGSVRWDNFQIDP